MIHAISSCPLIIEELLNIATKIKDGTLLVTDVVDGILDPSSDNDSNTMKIKKIALPISLLMKIPKALPVTMIQIMNFLPKR